MTDLVRRSVRSVFVFVCFRLCFLRPAAKGVLTSQPCMHACGTYCVDGQVEAEKREKEQARRAAAAAEEALTVEKRLVEAMRCVRVGVWHWGEGLAPCGWVGPLGPEPCIWP